MPTNDLFTNPEKRKAYEMLNLLYTLRQLDGQLWALQQQREKVLEELFRLHMAALGEDDAIPTVMNRGTENE